MSYYQGYDGRAQVKMTIVDKQDQTREREMTILRWDKPAEKDEKNGEKTDAYDKKKDEENCGEQKFYVYFRSPADINKTAFLVWKHLDKDDDRWLYLPALDLVKRVASTDKRTSFVGSHFFYEDVSGRNIKDDEHELVKETDNYYLLKNTPKDKDAVEFSYYEMWIIKKNFVVGKIDYYDKQGQKYRTYEALKVEDIQDFPTVTKSKMTDTKIGGYTILEYTKVEYNVNLPETLFTDRYLKQTPFKYLK